MNFTATVLVHAEDWRVTHQEVDCPLPAVARLRDSLPPESAEHMALTSVIDNALDGDEDEHAPTLWCHYCGALAHAAGAESEQE